MRTSKDDLLASEYESLDRAVVNRSSYTTAIKIELIKIIFLHLKVQRVKMSSKISPGQLFITVTRENHVRSSRTVISYHTN